jgi:hypothetical protein
MLKWRVRALMAPVAVAALMALGACGEDAAPTAPTDTVVALEQPAVWPAPDVVMTTPEASASDFVERVLGVPAELGDFRQGDLRSGEIEVFVRSEAGGPPMTLARAVLFLRQLGSADGWFVIGAANEHVTITTPEVGAELLPGPVMVAGVGRGFEATLVVSAFTPGDPQPLDQVVVFGGSLDVAQPYEAVLDLSLAVPGSALAIMVRGGVGLETDPGEFTVLATRVAP